MQLALTSSFMVSLSRFRHIEKQRTQQAEPATGAAPQRFEGVRPPAQPAAEADRSGAETRRFDVGAIAREARPALRVREDDDGLPFIRCCRCHFDNGVQARECGHCGVDLTTPMQRAFNQALHERLRAEREEERVEVARLDATRVEAQQEYKEILRRGMIPHNVPRATGARHLNALGKTIGIWLVRTVPNRRLRFALLALFGVGWIIAASLAPLAVSVVTVSAIGLGMLLAARRETGKG